MTTTKVTVLRTGDVCLYARVLDKTGKIGRYEVNGHQYHMFREAEAAFKKATNFSHNTNYKRETKS